MSEPGHHPPADGARGSARLHNPLGFALEFRDNKALVVLADRRLDWGVTIEQLVLEVPGVSFPFDLSGDAGQFRHHRCRLRLLAASVDSRQVLAALAGGTRQSTTLDNLSLRMEGGVGLLSGVFRLAERSSPFTARFAAEPWQGEYVRLAFFDVRLYGWQPVPPPALVGALVKRLAPLGARLQDAAFILLRPLEPLLRRLLPLHGWKIPDFAGMRVDRVRLDDDRLSIASARHPDEIPRRFWQVELSNRYQAALVSFLEGAEVFSAAEQSLAAGQLDGSRRLLLGQAGVEPGHPFASRRLCQLAAAQPGRREELTDLAEELLDRPGEHLPVLLALAAAEARAGNSQKAAAAYERAGQLAADRGEKEDAILAYHQAALLLGDDPAGAARNLERVVTLSPDDTAALEKLAAALERRGAWYRALRTWLRLARKLDDAEAVAECHQRMASIFLEHFDDVERARKHLDTALVHRPDHLPSLLTMAVVYQRRQQPERAVRVLQKVVELGGQQPDQTDLPAVRLRLAEIWYNELEQPESALLQLEAIIRQRPDHATALYRAAIIAEQLQRWDQAAEWYARLVELHDAGEALPEQMIKAAALGLGRIYAERPAGQEEARLYLSRAAALDPRDNHIWQHLEKIDREAGNWSQLVETLQRLAALEDGEQRRLARLLEAARISERLLNDEAGAERLFHQVLEMDPGNSEAVEGLTLLYRHTGRRRELAELLQRVAEQQPDAGLAARLWSELAVVLAEQPEQLPAALQAARRAWQLDPRQVDMVAALLQAARQAGRQKWLLELLEMLPLEAIDKSLAVDLALERAELLAAAGSPAGQVAEAYRQALEVDPHLLAAHRALADLSYRLHDWATARHHIEQVLRLAGEGGLTGPARTELHRRLAEIALQQDEYDLAAEQLRTVLSRHPHDERAAEKLAELLRQGGHWDQLAALYAQRAAQAQGERAAALHTAAATIWWERLRQSEPAIHQYQLAVAAAPESLAAPARLTSLQRIYVDQNRWQEAAETINRRIPYCPPREKARLYVALAALHSSRLGDGRAAERFWQQALEHDPAYRPAALFLARLRLQQQQLDEGLELTRRALDDTAQPGPLPVETRAELALAAARTAWKLRRQDEAAEMYDRYIKTFATRGYADVEEEAWERLELVLRQRKDHEQLARHYQTWLHTPSGQERRVVLTRSLAVLLFEHLEQPGEAIDMLAQLVESDADDQASVELLLDMLRRARRPQQLATLLQQQWQRAPQPEVRRKRLELLADTLQFGLYEPLAAAACWRQLLEMGHPRAAEHLAVLYRQESLYEPLVELLLEQARRASDPSRAVELWQELGQLARQQLDDPRLARQALERLVELDPSEANQDAWLELLRRQGQTVELRQALQQLAEDEADPERRRRLLLEHAELCLAEPELSDEGLSSLRQAIEVRAEPQLLERARQLYRSRQDWEAVADMTERLIDVGPAERIAGNLLELAELYQQQLGSPERAAAAIEQALDSPGAPAQEGARADLLQRAGELWNQSGASDRARADFEQAWQLDDTRLEVGQRLLELYQAERRDADCAAVLEKMAASQDDETAAGSLAQAATLRLDGDDRAAALADLQRALELVPAHPEANRLLLGLLLAEENWQELLARLTDLDDRLLADPEIAAGARRCWEQLIESEDTEEALAACRLALRLDAGEVRALWRGAHLLEEADRQEEAEQLWQALEEHAAELADQDRVQLQLRLARQDFARGRTEEAESRLRRCLEIDPTGGEAREFLHKIYQGAKRFGEQVNLLREEASSEPDTERRAEKLARAAAILDDELGNPTEAAELYHQVVDSDPGNRQAWEALSDLHRRLGQVDRQVTALERLAGLNDGPEQARLLQQAAQLVEEELDQPEWAQRLWQSLLELDPENRAALRALADHARRQGDAARLSELLATLAGHEREPAARAALLQERAELLAAELEQPAQAAELFEQLHELRPGDEDILERLQELYRQLERVQDQERILHQRIEICGRDEQLPELLRQLARLQYRQERPAAAIASLFEIAPSAMTVDDLQLLRRWCLASGDDVGWTRALVGLAERTRPADAGMLRRAALACWRQGWREQAGEIFEQLLQLDDGDVVAHRFLARLLADSQPRRAAGHIRWLLGHSHLLDPDDELALRRSLVQALADAESSQRIDALQMLLEGDPGDLHSARELAELLAAAGRDRELAELYGTMAAASEQQQAVKLWQRQARLFLKIEQPEAAVAAWRRALEIPGDHRAECARQLADLLSDRLQQNQPARQLLLQLVEWEPTDRQAWQKINELAWKDEDWPVVEQASRRLLELVDAQQRPGLLVGLGDVLVKQGKNDQATEVFGRACQEDPAYDLAYQRLEALLLEQEADQSRLATFYRDWADSPAAGSRRVDLLLQAARHLERAGQREEAAAALRQLLELEPDRSEAIEMLAALLASLGAWEELLQVLARRGEHLQQPDRRLALSFEMGQICKEHLRDLDKAAEHFRHCLEIDPEHPASLEELADIYYQGGQWEASSGLYDKLAERGLAGSRFLVAFRRAEMAERLDQQERAVELYRRCAELNPTFLPSRQKLIDLLESLGRLQDAAAETERFVELVAGEGFEDLQLQYLQRLAELHHRLLQFSRSVELHRQVLQLDENNPLSLRRLREQALATLDWARAAELLERELAVIAGAPEADAAPAAQAKLSGAASLPSSGGQRGVKQAGAPEADAAPAAQAKLSGAASLPSSGGQRGVKQAGAPEADAAPAADLWLLLGDIYRRHLDDDRRALLAYRNARRLAPRDVNVTWKCWQATRSLQNSEEIIDIGKELLAGELTIERRLEVHQALARAYQVLEKPRQALEQLEQVLRIGPVEITYVEEAAALCRQLGNWQRYCVLAGQALEARIEQGLDPEDILDGYLRMATVYHEHLQDIDRAAACIRRALDFHPRDRELLRRLGNLYASNFDTLGQAVGVFRELAGMDPTDPQNYRYLARLEAARGDIDRAGCYYAGLRLLVPGDDEARRYLDKAGPARVPQQALSGQQWGRVLLHPEADCLLQRIVSLLAPYLEPVFPSDPQLLASLPPLAPESHPELFDLVQQTTMVFGCRPVEVRLARNDEYRCWLESGPQPVVVISDTVIGRSTPAEARFLLARQLVLAAMGHVLSERLRRSDLQTLLALLGRLVRPDMEPPTPLPPTSDQYLEAFRQAIPQPVLEQASELLRRWSLEPRVHDIDSWLQGARLTADRAGLLMSGDLVGALGAMSRLSPADEARELSFVSNRALMLEKDPAMMSLFRFAFSESYLRLRRELGAVAGPA